MEGNVTLSPVALPEAVLCTLLDAVKPIAWVSGNIGKSALITYRITTGEMRSTWLLWCSQERAPLIRHHGIAQGKEGYEREIDTLRLVAEHDYRRRLAFTFGLPAPEAPAEIADICRDLPRLDWMA